MEVTINGESRSVPDAITVTALLEHLGLPTGRVAIERNRDILPRSRWQGTAVAAGDNYEIVQLVGGG